MTILKADGFDFYTTLAQRWNGAGGAISTSKFRTGRGALKLIGGQACKHTQPSSDAHATYGIACAIWREANSATSSYLQWYGDTGATQHLTLTMLGDTSGNLRRGNNAGTVLYTFPIGSFPTNVWNHYEAKALISDTVGTFEIRRDGNPTPLVALTGLDTKNAGTNVTFDAVAVSGAGTGSVETWVDDFVLWNGAGSVNNDFIGDTEVVCLLPNGDGATLNGTPSTGTTHYTLVDETTPNTTDYVTLAADGDLDLYDFENLTNTGGTIRALQTLFYAAKVGTDAAFIQDTLRISGVNYSAASDVLSTGFAYLARLRELSPATSAAFTAAIINAMQAGPLKKDT